MTLDEYRRQVAGPKTKKPRKYPERALQIAVADTLRLRAPELLWWFCPNGGNLSPAQRSDFQKMGLRPGVADLHFLLPGGRLAMIELKAGKGSQSPAQKDFEPAAIAAGALYTICRTVAEVEGALMAWGVALRRMRP